LGGSTFASGLFLGFLTYASATSAPFTGAIADRIGRRRTLIIASAVILLFAIGYGTTTSYRVMLALVVVHGVFWSGLLSASSAYLTSLLPEQRRAEGISYWGLSSVAAVALAPPIAFWIMRHGGWMWICVSWARSTWRWASSRFFWRMGRRTPRSSACRSGPRRRRRWSN